MSLITQLPVVASYFWLEPNLDNDEVKTWLLALRIPQSQQLLSSLYEGLVDAPLDGAGLVAAVSEAARTAAAQFAVPLPVVLAHLRFALTGRRVGAGISTVAGVLGRERVRNRLHRAIPVVASSDPM